MSFQKFSEGVKDKSRVGLWNVATGSIYALRARDTA